MATEVTGRIRHHARADCDGHPCPFHTPSLHPMIEEPMNLRESGLIERMCKHGVGHPDPDSVTWFQRHGLEGFGIHGCDGCCSLTRESGRQGGEGNRG